MQCRRCKHNVMALTMMLIRCIINFIDKKCVLDMNEKIMVIFPSLFIKKNTNKQTPSTINVINLLNISIHNSINIQFVIK